MTDEPHGRKRAHDRTEAAGRGDRRAFPATSTAESLRRLGAVAALAAAIPALAACEGSSAIGPGEATAGADGEYRVQVARTGGAASAALASMSVEDGGIRAARLPEDAVEAVELSLTAVEVHRVSGDTAASDTTEESEEGPDARWVRLEVRSDSAGDADSVVLDLTELPDSGGVTVATGELEPGTYEGLRLYFDEARLVLADTARLGSGNGGRTYPPGTYDLFIPSGEQTGVKLPDVGFTMTSDGGETTTVLADTEASIQNINVTGRGFLMTPVLTTASEAEDGADSDSADAGSTDG